MFCIMNISKSLHNLEFYNDSMENINPATIVKTYCKILREYMTFIYDNKEINGNVNNCYLICRGINTVTHIFQQILLYTKNIDVTSYYAEKSFYYYIEFIEQMMNGSNSYLQLTSKDATLFVYKKIIYDINQHIKKNLSFTTTEKELLNRIFNTNQIYVNLLIYFVNTIDWFDDIQMYRNMLKRVTKIMEKILSSKTFENKCLDKIDYLCDLIKILTTKNTDLIKIIGVVNEYIKFMDGNDITKLKINEKVCDACFDDYLSNKTNKYFIKWLYK